MDLGSRLTLYGLWRLVALGDSAAMPALGGLADGVVEHSHDLFFAPLVEAEGAVVITTNAPVERSRSGVRLGGRVSVGGRFLVEEAGSGWRITAEPGVSPLVVAISGS